MHIGASQLPLRIYEQIVYARSPPHLFRTAVGDAAGSWDQRVPLAFDVARQQWRVQLWGLAPGRYRYKYIVDGAWVVDLAAATETDAWGNVNNVVTAGDSRAGLAASTADRAAPPQQQQQQQQQQAGRAADGACGTAVAAAPSAAVLPAEPLQPATPAELVAAASPAARLHMARLGAAMLALLTRQPTQRRLSRSALI